MKRFAFSLEKLLETKLALEEAAQRRLADAQRGLVAARDELNRLQALIRVESERIERLAGRCTDKQELLRMVRYRQSLQHVAYEQGRQVQKYEEAVTQLREQLRAIMMQRQSLENLQAIERRTWTAEQNALERKDMDEIGIQRYLRRAEYVV